MVWFGLAIGRFGFAEQPTDIRVLFLGDAGRNHEPKNRFVELEAALEARGFQFSYTESLADLNQENLADFDAVILYADILEIDPAAASALYEFVSSGGGFLPIHCASACFRNSPEYINLVGAQFDRHGSGVFRAHVSEFSHPIVQGYGGFESWDESYVHSHHRENERTVLEYRADSNGREPWTWIKPYGKGRVFYTARGHDSRTWTHPGFQNLIERGLRWSTGNAPESTGSYQSMATFPVPSIAATPDDLPPLEMQDVGPQIPVYRTTEAGSGEPELERLMQKPLSPEASLQHLVVPDGFHVELFAAEPDLGGKPICMAWDAAGRCWVGETVDYPNSLADDNRGNDRIRICEDTDRDGRADKFTVFAEGLSIPSTIAFSFGGVIVQNGTETLFLQDTDNDDVADIRSVLLSGWEMSDTHGGVSNFQYGPDNWIWGMQGYNQSAPVGGESDQDSFRMGFFRMKPDGSEVEFVRSTNNNTWGLGFSEEGFVFGSTANGTPSVFMPIANRYYERVHGWLPSLTLSSIADSHLFRPITSNIRQGDWHGGFTAAAGHALYTARKYPSQYWNRVAFVNGPTGHLVGAFVLSRQGTEFRSTNAFNMLASDDEWTAPIMSEVGPDGQVWVIDWYNYIIQHNPTPDGFESGKGGAYETELRDKQRGRIYRIVADQSEPNDSVSDYPNVQGVHSDQLINALSHPTMLIRKHAQRLLVERGQADVCDALCGLVRDQSTDAIGLNVGVMHALWTLDGLGLLIPPRADATAMQRAWHESACQSVCDALRHPSAGVRRAAAGVLPPTWMAMNCLLDAKLFVDPDRHVRLAALLAVSDFSPDNSNHNLGDNSPAMSRIGNARIGNALLAAINDPNNLADRWIPDAVISASAMHSDAVLRGLQHQRGMPVTACGIIERVAEHHARDESRGVERSDDARLLAELNTVEPHVIEAVISGFSAGTHDQQSSSIDTIVDLKLESIAARVPAASKAKLVRLASLWGSRRFAKATEQAVDDLLAQVHQSDLSVEQRVAAARQAVDLKPNDRRVAIKLLDEITAMTPEPVAIGLVESLENCRWEGLGSELIGRLSAMKPPAREAAMAQLLRRPAATLEMLDAAKKGRLVLSDLSLATRENLISHPDPKIRRSAKDLLAAGDELPRRDRFAVLKDYAWTARHRGDAQNGKQVFIKNCSQCHVHRELGYRLGPDLTGMAVLPRSELLVHILDPNRNVEANYRSCTIVTNDGMILRGMLSDETKTSIGLVTTDGKTNRILRDDVEELFISSQSIMPEGFEKSIGRTDMSDLLAFLVEKHQYVPIELAPYATAISSKGLFHNDGPDRFVFPDWTPKTFHGVPFQLTDPMGQMRRNIISLHSDSAPIPSRMPKSVTIPCGMAAKAIHLLSGVGGWSYPFIKEPSVSMTVRLHYRDKEIEDHPLINGVHFADYLQRNDVSGSQFAFEFEKGQQMRYLSIKPKRQDSIKQIEFIKGEDVSAPVVMAVTVETANDTSS
ncbi:PVC-type heme-binding CxxCH protein [Neorhodopirellula pilleata]|uniref:Trehalose utilization n=1 Tax=Neorhodopirellula pilleata TaxID=2714738 RepID=A0A5C5ZX70_9BACT|nr:PVC-type heme-binding CxxCH protein [Neorhodopirellula pilleata]TWT92214.1 Trehalose utilization [Neorhodopirellula pilleata]